MRSPFPYNYINIGEAKEPKNDKIGVILAVGKILDAD